MSSRCPGFVVKPDKCPWTFGTFQFLVATRTPDKLFQSLCSVAQTGCELVMKVERVNVGVASGVHNSDSTHVSRMVNLL
jgi:hypothetical protein